jgi:hypothetical protein
MGYVGIGGEVVGWMGPCADPSGELWGSCLAPIQPLQDETALEADEPPQYCSLPSPAFCVPLGALSSRP